MFKKFSNVKLRENKSSGSRVCSIRTDRHTDRLKNRQIDLTKEIVAFRNFAKLNKHFLTLKHAVHTNAIRF